MALPLTFDFTYGGAATTLQAWDANWERLLGGGAAGFDMDGSSNNLHTTSASLVAYRYVGEATPADQGVQCTIVAFHASDWKGGGGGVRVQASGDGYYAGIFRNAARIHKVVSGSASDIATYASATSAGAVVKITAIGSTIKVYINAVEVMSVTDTTFATGDFGLYGYDPGNGFIVDDVVLSDEGTPSTDRTADIAASLPVPVVAMDVHGSGAGIGPFTLTTTARNGTEATFQSDDEITEITLSDGQPAVKMGASATYIECSAYTTSNGGYSSGRNGAMIDPNPSSSVDKHGYDDRHTGYYDAALNVGIGIAGGTPADITPASGSYKTLCIATSITTPAGVPLISRWVPIHVFHSDFAPVSPSTTLTPWSAGPTKQATLFDESDLWLGSLDDIDTEAINAYFGAALVTQLEADYANIWCDHIGNFPAREMHPTLDMPGFEYARDLMDRVSDALVMAQNGTLRTTTLLRRMFAQAVNFYGNRVNGGGHYGPDGGHNQGRKPLWLFAYELSGRDAQFTPMADDTVNSNEDGQSFQIDAAAVTAGCLNVGDDTAATNPASIDDYTFGVSHSTDATQDDAIQSKWGGSGYKAINLTHWGGAAWAWNRMLGYLGSRALWNWDAYFGLLEQAVADAPAEMANGYLDLWNDATNGYRLDEPTTGADRTADITATLPMPVVVMDADVFTAPSRTADITASLPMVQVMMRGTINFDAAVAGGGAQVLRGTAAKFFFFNRHMHRRTR